MFEDNRPYVTLWSNDFHSENIKNMGIYYLCILLIFIYLQMLVQYVFLILKNRLCHLLRISSSHTFVE